MFRKFLPIVVTLALIMTSVIALDPLGVSQPQDSFAQDDATVLVRLVHAVPGAGAVDVYADGNLIAPNFEFAQATPHLAFPAGDHVLAVRGAGEDPANPAILEEIISLVPSSTGYRQATIVVQADAEGAVQFGQYVDDLTPKGLGGSRIHAINAVGDLSAVDFLISNGAPLLENVAFNVPGGTIDPPVGTYELLVAPNGGGVEASIFELGEVSLNTNTLYTIILLEDAELEALVLSQPMFADPNTDTVLTAFAHASFDAPTVDVYADDVLILKNFAPGTVTQHLPIPAGDITLAIREAGTPANSEPAYEQTVSLASFSGAATIAAIGSLSESTFSFAYHDDDILNIKSDQARIVVLNSAATGPATVALGDKTLVDGLGSFTTSEVNEIDAGIYTLTGSVDGENTPETFELADQSFVGGSYYTIIVGLADEAVVAYNGTAINADELSLPGAEMGVAIAANPTNDTSATDNDGSTTDSTEGTDDSSSDSDLQVTPTAVPVTEVPPTQAPVVTAPPATAQQNVVFGVVNLNAGVNLQCREYPTTQAFSLALVPNGAQVLVRGWAGPPDLEEGQEITPVEEGSFENPTEVEDFDEVWLNIDWTGAEGGTLRCWTRADLLQLTFRNQAFFEPESLFELQDVAVFPPIVDEIPYNYPGGGVDSDVLIAPPTPARQDPVGTVNVDAGVSLHLRRTPDANGESLALLPNGADMYVLGRTLTEISTDIGQPDVPDWLYVEYTDAGGTTTTGWVSGQYIVVTQFGRLIDTEDIELVTQILPGEVLVEGVAPPPGGDVSTAADEYLGQVVFINVGANLNMRSEPSADALVLAAIPANSQMVVLGRTGDGEWLNVRYEIAGEGVYVGWAASQFIEVSRNDQSVDIIDLPITNDDVDTMVPEVE